MAPLSEHCLVLVEAPPFHGMMQRHQQLARRLAAHLPVVYCQYTPSAAAVYLTGRGQPAELRMYRNGLIEEAPNLYLTAGPPGQATKFHFRKATAANMKKTGEFLDKLLAAKGFTKRILWLGHPKAIEIGPYLPHALTVYDCYDAFGEFENETHVTQGMKELEAEALKQADLVFASAKKLREHCIAGNPHTYLIPNGVEFAHFAQEEPAKPTKDYGVDIAALKAKGLVVGYVGHIGSWFDHMLMISTAQLNPKISFVFIGPIGKKIESLRGLRNTHFTGQVDYQDIPWFLQHCDALVIPFLGGPITDNLNPIKLYEYFATGKPVVTTDFPEVRDFEGLISIGNNGRAFYTKLEIELNLSGNTPQKAGAAEMRVEIARENAWDARVERVVALLESALDGVYPEPPPEDAARPGARAKEFKERFMRMAPGAIGHSR